MIWVCMFLGVVFVVAMVLVIFYIVIKCGHIKNPLTFIS